MTVAQRASTADQKWHFHFPQCPAHSTTISQLQAYRSDTDSDYKSQFPTVQFSMPPDWRRRRERETSYMLGLTAVFAPYPLGGGACGARRPPRVGWGCGSTRGPAKGVAWGGAGRAGERGRGRRVGGKGGGAVWGGVHPLVCGCAEARRSTTPGVFQPPGQLGRESRAVVLFLSPPRENDGGRTPSLI